MNERVTLVCKYLNNLARKDDVLFMTFVGALNVGSIKLGFDQDLKTNENFVLPDKSQNEEYFSVDYTRNENSNGNNKDNNQDKDKDGYIFGEQGFSFRKKDELGWFNFGSTIVLVFSCDKDKEIISKYKEGEQVKIGQSLIEVVKHIH